jgi:peptide/nickel transport system substrate-binding protein
MPARAERGGAAARRGWGRRLAATVLVALGPVLVAGAAAQPAGGAAGPVLRIASGFDPQTMDPHALALLYHTRVVSQIYEGLVGRDEQFRLEPALATAWRPLEPTVWRFTLREGVVFHDGSPLTAEDVVFSIERAIAPPSQRAFQLKGVTGARRVDARTVDLLLEAPDAVLPEKLPYIAIMSRAWSLANKVERAQDFNGKQETHAVRHANGTGPYRLVRYEPDVRTVLRRHDGWWGRSDRRTGNVAEVVFTSVRSDATRLASLASGEMDLVLDPPFQDVARLAARPRIRLAQTADLGQQYLTFDQARDTLAEGEAKRDGRDVNPFRDRRVRQAVYQAIDVDLIVKQVLRGQAVPTGALLSPRVDGSPADLDRRLPFDPAKARSLLAEAGFPEGFSVTLDCVNIAFREAVCQAVSAMLTRVGIRTTLRSSGTNQFFPKLSQASASFIEYGWSPLPDAWPSLNALFRSYDRAGFGTFNAGRYSQPAVDRLIDDLRTEPDLTRRRAKVATVLRLVADDIAYVPLYRRTLTWAMKPEVSLVQWPNDTVELRWVRVTPVAAR